MSGVSWPSSSPLIGMNVWVLFADNVAFEVERNAPLLAVLLRLGVPDALVVFFEAAHIGEAVRFDVLAGFALSEAVGAGNWRRRRPRGCRGCRSGGLRKHRTGGQ